MPGSYGFRGESHDISLAHGGAASAPGAALQERSLAGMDRRHFAIGAAALSAGFSAPVWAQTSPLLTQTALVIGNNAYGGPARLINAKRDATLMHETFGRLGAKSVLQLDLSGADLTRAIEDHVIALQRQPPGIAWFFFSGHGAYLNGKSYVLGTDASLQSQQDLRARSLDLDRLKSFLESVRAQVCVVVVDACRNNPFLTRGLSAATPGLIPEPWGGSIVAFSTAPYTQALDWPDRPNGPYASALSTALLSPASRSIEQVFKETSDQVYAATKRQQLPGYYAELRAGVVLNGGRVSLQPKPSPPVTMSTGNTAAGRALQSGLYRADLLQQDPYAGTEADEWQRITAGLEDQAFRLDPASVTRALRDARQPRASDPALTLGGLLFSEGRKVPLNRKAAVQLFDQAAAHGFVTAQVLRGELAFSQQDYATAYRWLSLAARSNWSRPNIDLAQLLASGQGTAPDPAAAARHLMKALRNFTPPNR